MREPTELEKAYFAGILDGEGYVGGHTFNQSQSGHKNYDIRVSIGMSYEGGLLDVAKDIWGGNVRLTKQGVIVWDIKGKICEKFLRDVMPYVYVKNRQIALALEIRATKTYQGKSVPEDVMEKRIWLHNEIKKLNSPSIWKEVY